MCYFSFDGFEIIQLATTSTTHGSIYPRKVGAASERNATGRQTTTGIAGLTR